MNFSDAETRTIGDVIASRTNGTVPCAWCGKQQYTLTDGIAFFATHKTVVDMPLSGYGMPCVGLVCGGCGHVEWFNMLRLGLERMVK